jgi:predicted Zn-dependent protease
MRVQPVLAAASIICALFAAPAAAISLLRDAGVEHALKQIATPVLKSAGLSPDRVKILVVDSGTLNAFVVSNDAIFIHWGLIDRLSSARALQGVIAHEAAHITNGHLTRRMSNLRSARTVAGLGLALAAVASAAGNSDAGAGLALGVQSAAQRAFLRHTRAEEIAADQSAARFLQDAGIDPIGLVEALGLFRGQELLKDTRQDVYVRSHPLSRDRIRAVEALASTARSFSRDPGAQYWFARARGKLTAYKRAAKWTNRRAGESGHPEIAHMRRAMAAFKQSDGQTALREVNKALALRPKDAFYHDLKGEILLRARNFPAAVKAFQNASTLAPNDALILAGYGRALLADGKSQQAVSVLEKARRIDYRDGIMLRDLARAYALRKQPGMAALVSAEAYALGGRFKDAGIQAKRAAGLLAEGSGPWQRAQDVISAAQRAAK